jgi:MinD-like ATPase involved in chromosome partitioning or flagellar assembly
MGRAFFVTPVYIFSSIKAGSGKASILASLSVFLNNTGNKVAIIDIDSSFPDKLKSSFPRSIRLHEYPDLIQIVNNNESRYQRTFYFTETDQISYFPAMNLLRPEQLFNDTGMRDFFLQTRATFDYLLINFPAGDKFCLAASQILTNLWQGNPPVSIIVSTSELQSLVKLDGITRKLPALSFQLRENTMVLFNRVPGSLEEQKLSDTALTSHEIKKIFKFPNQFFVGHNEEFPHQKNVTTPIVLKTDSLLNLAISRLLRQLQHTGQLENENEDGEFLPCLDGPLLEKLSPYLEKLLESAAAELVTNPANLQVFLEESQGRYRVRLRLTGRQDRLLRNTGKIEARIRSNSYVMPSPELFSIYQTGCRLKKMLPIGRDRISGLQAKPVYRFNDCFDQQVSKFASLDFFPRAGRFPSPIIFRHSQLTKDIPTLSQILGFVKKEYTKFPFAANSQIFSIPGVTHFFIPPEFELAYDKDCAYAPQVFANLKISEDYQLCHEYGFIPAYRLRQYPIPFTSTLPDLFARNQSLDLGAKFLSLNGNLSLKFSDTMFAAVPAFSVIFSQEVLDDNYVQASLQQVSTASEIIPKILPLFENEKESEQIEKSRPVTKWFEKIVPKFSPELFEQPLPIPQLRVEPDLALQQILPRKTASFAWSELAPRLGISLNLTAYTARPASPKVFLHTNTDTSVTIIQPRDLNLPEKFKIDLELLEHHLEVGFAKILSQNSTIEVNKISNQQNIDHSLFFKTSFYEGSDFRGPEKAFELNRPENFKQKFTAPIHALKRIRLDLPVNDQRNNWDILQIRLISDTDRDYLAISSPSAYRCNQIADNQSSKRCFSPCKTSMLEISSNLPRENLFYSSFGPGRSYKLKIDSLRHTCISLPEIADPDFSSIKFSRKKAGYNFAEPQLRQPETVVKLVSQRANPGSSPSFSYFDPVFYVCQFHLHKFDLFFNTFSSTLDEITTHENRLIDHCTPLNVSLYQPDYRLDPYDFELPTNLPIRHKKPESPEIYFPSDQISKLKIIDLSPDLCFLASKVRRANLSPAGKKVKKNVSPLSLPTDYPLFKPSLETTSSNSFKRFNFRIPPPNAIEEIYCNLIRQAHYLLKADLPLSFTPLSIKSIDFLTNHSFRPLQFEEGIYFVRRILHSPEKIRFTGEREPFKIINPKLKDLFKLAQQTSRKFTEVSSRAGT